MPKINEVAKKIEVMRARMHNLIEQKENLIDPEIVKVSKMIDSLLNEYNILANKEN